MDISNPFFDGFPTSGSHALSVQVDCQSPFYVPAGRGLMIFGSANHVQVRERMPVLGHEAVATPDGRALMCLWISHFFDSTAGPYHELTVTVLVSPKPLQVPWRNAWTPLAVQLDPQVRICEYVLLLDNPVAVAYGRDLHGFDKHMGVVELEDAVEGGRRVHGFRCLQGGQLVVEGAIDARPGPVALARSFAGVCRAFGLRPTLSKLSEKTQIMDVVTPATVKATRSHIHFQGDFRLHAFGRRDRLVIGDQAPMGKLLRDVGFQPTAVQRLLSLRGVMPLPIEA